MVSHSNIIIAWETHRQRNQVDYCPLCHKKSNTNYTRTQLNFGQGREKKECIDIITEFYWSFIIYITEISKLKFQHLSFYIGLPWISHVFVIQLFTLWLCMLILFLPLQGNINLQFVQFSLWKQIIFL